MEAHLSSYIINTLFKTLILFTAQASRAQSSHSQAEVFCDPGVTRKTGHPQRYRIWGGLLRNIQSHLQVTPEWRKDGCQPVGSRGLQDFHSRLSAFPSTGGALKSTICLPVLARKDNSEVSPLKLSSKARSER